MLDPFGVEDHWYETASGSLRQGDILEGVSVPLPPAVFDMSLPVEEHLGVPIHPQVSNGSWVVLTPSCDLENGRVREVLLAEARAATPEELGMDGGKSFLQWMEVVRQGKDVSKFLLPDHAERGFPASVVFFRSLTVANLASVLAFAQREHLRIRHPFREMLAVAFATSVMQVGPETGEGTTRRIERIWPKHMAEHDD